MLTGDRIRQLPLLIAQVAEHGPLYERVSFHNQPQWRAANEPLWNAYRLASMTGQRSQMTSILLDILRLPQRVLPRLGRSGRAARRRAVAATKHRLHTEGTRLRQRYNCPNPDANSEQRLPMSTDTMDCTATLTTYRRPPPRAASTAAAAVIRLQTADTTDSDTDADTETVEVEATESQRTVVNNEDERDEPSPWLPRHINSRSSRMDPDRKAALRATHLVGWGQTRKAAQVLHSTTQLADLHTAEAQETMVSLHPRPPVGTALPTLPQIAPHAVLEDDAGMRRLIVQSDNGTAAGPSGWGGNMLSVLVQSDICRLGLIALFRDIINGELPSEARELLLTSRLVALAKPNSDGLRPIAVGELLYRLAAIVAVRRVSKQAAELLAPHQYGLGVAAGAEKIVHSLQHELTDTDKRLALLQLDIANAFNSCDRARLLTELYELPDLQPLYRLADFAYAQPSALVLSGCDGKMIESVQGVRQGDPLSALLFCVYMRNVLQQVSEQTGVRVYGFFDDISLLGTPQQLVAALGHVQQSLPAVSLQLNTAKSHFTYFHDHLTPLTAAVLGVLSASNIELHHSWVSVVGVVVGRDDAAIRAGIQSTLAAAGNHDTFLRRLQLEEMPLQVAMIMLRQSMVPAMNYWLRCVAPVCIEGEASSFDQRVVEAAMHKLDLQDTERGEGTVQRLQRRLKDGGWSLTSAVRTSPAAFLASVAACCDEPSFKQHCDAATPVPHQSQLWNWVDDGMRRVRCAASGSKYQSDIDPLLPATAGLVFHHYSTSDPSTTAPLQKTLNAKATKHNVEAAVQVLEEQAKGRGGNKWELAHYRATSGPGALTWKMVRPEGPHLRLSDVEYAVAARLNLGLQPFNPLARTMLPPDCPLCKRRVSLDTDPWHWMTCASITKGELSRRHDAVVDAISRVARQVGAQVRTEVQGLDPHSVKRPDLQIVFPGRMLLTDVVVTHTLTPAAVVYGGNKAINRQAVKKAKYTGVASRLGAELLNMSLDTSGGMASEAFELVRAISDEGARWSGGTWNSAAITRHLMGAIATAVQRGNALTMLSGYTRAVRAGSGAEGSGAGEEEDEACSGDVDGEE